MNIAMFGGSFDPIHNGHISLSQAFVKELSLDKVIIMPAFISPFKQQGGTASPLHRLNMCRLAFEGSDNIEVSSLELDRGGCSYTYMTLQTLAQEYAGAKLFLITGADSFMSIHKWKHPELIFQYAEICAVPRGNDSMESLKNQEEYLHTLGAGTRLLGTRVMTVSSTQIRTLIKQGKSISSLVPESVEEYILRNRLYT